MGADAGPATDSGTGCQSDADCVSPGQCQTSEQARCGFDGECIYALDETDCDDADPCTDDLCVPREGCQHSFNQAPCDDCQRCTVNDRCDGAGTCSGTPDDTRCDDGSGCTADRCDAGVCLHTVTSTSCDEGWAIRPLGSGGFITCGFGCYSGHVGQDWQYSPGSTSYGQSVYVVADGVVAAIESGHAGCDDPWNSTDQGWSQPNNQLVIEHGPDLFTRYGHLKEVAPGLSVGSFVTRGQLVAQIGNVGPISPCDNDDPNVNAHLHFEVGTSRNGTHLDGEWDPDALETWRGDVPFSGALPSSTCCSGTFSDSGGDWVGYQNGEENTFTIAPAGARRVTVTFREFETEEDFDFLTLHDGSSSADPTLATLSGEGPVSSVMSSGGALTVGFTSDGNKRRTGWIADWTCEY